MKSTDVSIHPVPRSISRQMKKKEKTHRDLDGAYRWHNRIDGGEEGRPPTSAEDAA